MVSPLVFPDSDLFLGLSLTRWRWWSPWLLPPSPRVPLSHGLLDYLRFKRLA